MKIYFRISIFFIVIAALAAPLYAVGTNTPALSTNQNESCFSIYFKQVRFKYNLLDYIYIVNGIEVKPERMYSNIVICGSNYAVVTDEFGRLILATNFNPAVNSSTLIYPQEKWIGNWHPRFHIGGGNWLTGGIDFSLSRYGWVGAGLGCSYWSDDALGGSFSIFSLSVEAGYYFVGDPSQDFRMGLGGMLSVHLVEPYAKWVDLINGFYSTGGTASSNEYKNYGVTLEGFTTIEYDRFFVRLNIRFDFVHPAFLFLPSVGMKF
ncbi:MAG: hypothetical protein A2Y33_01170 [Spirochaetes bacterium GWF1_51_8]|nr:MAG: hypothetical protein A2Y33_01170 [Spirochaetes bacterium GWF1_51_8]